MMISSDMSAHAAGSDLTNKFPWKWWLKDLKNLSKNGRRVLSTFSCGGGSSMGYKLAGYEVLGNVEIDPRVIKVYRKNLHPKYSFLMDIRDFIKSDIPEELYGVDILDGSPPCSVFSMSGRREKGWGTEKVFREGQAEQRLDDLFFSYVELAAKIKPKVVIAENVIGLLQGNAKGYVNEIIKKFDSAGYVIQLFRLDSSRMGVPQKRERVFFVGHRNDLNLPKLKLSFNERVINFGEVREEHGKPLGEKSVVLKRLLSRRRPTDGDINDISERLRHIRSGFTMPILADDKPATCLTAGGTPFRHCDGHCLTDNDLRNIQSFPQDYDFMDQPVQYICGMSVPPVMMANLSNQVYEQWLKG